MDEAPRRLKALSSLSDRFRNLRRYLAGKTFDGRRDLFEALGYKADGTLTFHDYDLRYRRGGIARRIIKLPVDFTWQSPPVIFEDEDPEKSTDFEDAVAALAKRVKLWKYLRRVDRVARIGTHAVLFLGFNDGKPFDEEVTAGEGLDLTYLSVFSEIHAKVTALDLNSASERCGLPLTYELDFARTRSSPDAKQKPTPAFDTLGKKTVHWSRVIHVCEDSDEDDVYARPVLEAGWNDLDDLAKVKGATAEAAWKNAVRGVVYSADKDAIFDTEDKQAKSDMNEEIQALEDELRSHALVQGVTPHVLASSVPDPTGAVTTSLGQLAGTYGTPQRILIGSERGNLASTQDRENLATVVRDRQSNHAEDVLVRPFVDRCVKLAIVPTPTKHPDGEGAYGCSWPDPVISSALERVDVALKTAQAAEIVSRMNGGEVTLQGAEFREMIQREPLTEDEAFPEHLEPDPVPPALDPNAPPVADPENPEPAAPVTEERGNGAAAP